MLRQSAFINAQKHLKGALHCHTTRSDGKGDPDVVIRYHAERGYDFMALTDHERYNYINFAPDTNMTIIPGMEIGLVLPGSGIHCHHIVSIGPEKANGNGFDQDQTFIPAHIEGTKECQDLLDMLHANNNMTIYCHPEWSGVSAREFETLKGNLAMEIWNSTCALNFGLDNNAAYWDELLIQGVKIYGVATDDGHAMSTHCNGWVMVNSQNTVSAILDALNSGAFYSSCGPEIYDFRIEDGHAIVECSPVKNIQFRHFRVPYRHFQAPEEETITFAHIPVRSGTNYIRAVVQDEKGRRAWTNPIFID